MIKSLLLLFFITSIPCLAADWEFVKKTSYGDVYFDKSTIAKNRNQEYYVGILTNFPVQQEGIDRLINGNLVYDTHFKPLSSKSAYIIHCAESKTSLLGSMYFSDRMAKGRKIFSELDSNPIWIEDSVADLEKIYPVIRQSICRTK